MPCSILLSELEPVAELGGGLEALGQAAARLDGRRRIARAVVDRPGLLTGQGARAEFPGVLRFISALVKAGAVVVVEPPCPRCGRREQRLERPGRDRASPVRRVRQEGAGTALRPVRRGEVPGSPQRQRAADLPELLAPGPGAAGNHAPSAGTAGGYRRDHRGRAGLPELPAGSRCCLQHLRGSPGAAGSACHRPPARRVRPVPQTLDRTCSRCGSGAPLKGGTLREPLCARCLVPDPAFWKRCAVCQETWQLSTAECTRCSLDRKLTQIFTRPGGTAAPELDRLREALVRVDRPDLMLDWLKKAGVAAPSRPSQATAPSLTRRSTRCRRAAPSSTCGRCWWPRARFPPGTERLVALERWIGQVIAGRTSPEHGVPCTVTLSGTKLRRLRSRAQGGVASRQQVKNVRDQVTAAAAFLDWLEARGLTLGTCTQAELDQWLAGNSSYLARSANFARWAVARRHASRLTAPSSRWTGPAGPLNQDRRWRHAPAPARRHLPGRRPGRRAPHPALRPEAQCRRSPDDSACPA